MRARLEQCQQWVAGSSLNADVGFEGISTDTRSAAAGSLFVALRGDTYDAHAFLGAAVQRDVAALVIAHDTPAPYLAGLPPTLPLLRVADTRIALGAIGHGWRNQFTLPLIAVTGSNGKTTVKEMIAAILAAAVGAAHSMATRGNFNNDIGVPLTLVRLHAGTRAAVVELGMNHPGEITRLAAMAQPTVALVNNAQREHQEFMATVAAVAQENGAVFDSLPADGVAVFPADDEFTELWRGMAQAGGPRRVMTFGLDARADVGATYVVNAFGSTLAVRAGAAAFSVELAAAGEHNVRNALAAITCTLAIGLSVADIVRGLESFAPVAGRLQRRVATSGAVVIDDTYNANPDSVRAAIDVLAQGSAPRILVLGDMGEVGDNGPAFHAEIGAYAATRGIDHLLSFGAQAATSARAFGAHGQHFDDLAALQAAVLDLATAQAVVLVKGSRFMKMERIVAHLLDTQVQDSH